MDRADMLARARSRRLPWDFIVIGGGATGAGVALDAASRGYSILLLEQSDFGKGASSRSTKLIHGGVRYLEQGNIPLVREALRERGLLVRNAPHLVRSLPFVVPTYAWWQTPFYGAGLKLYNLLAGKYGFEPSRILSREETLERLPNIRRDGLLGGVIYYDGQFDDCRLLIELVATAAAHGATLVNYAAVTAILKRGDGTVAGVRARDAETGEEFEAEAKVVINAAGPFADAVRRLAEPSPEPIIAPSQGIHLVFDKSFLSAENAIMVPHTSDGRVLFAIPWLGHTLVGTTDTPVPAATLEPVPQAGEVAFILETASLYLARKPGLADVLSVFAGIRPLIAGAGRNTARLARSHLVRVGSSGLLTICGGKWTTYRHMAEDAVNQAAELAGLPPKKCRTRELEIGGPEPPETVGPPLDPALPYTAADIAWAARRQMARTVEDALARRTRALFLNVKAAMRIAPAAAAVMARELNRDSAWADDQALRFKEVARHYLLTGILHPP